MSCMKCGKEVSEGQVFCQECLAEMEKYPVKPGTPLPLPIRPREAVVHKRSYRKSRKPEEQIVSLRRWLSILCVICWILLIALTLAVMVIMQLMGNPSIHLLPA